MQDDSTRLCANLYVHSLELPVFARCFLVL